MKRVKFLHFFILSIFSPPGCKDAASCATLSSSIHNPFQFRPPWEQSCTNCQWTVDIFIIVIVLYSHSIILSFSIPCTVRAILSSGKMHQLSVDGAMGGPGVVDYRKGCLIILTTIVLRDIPCISSKALSLPECDHSYRCLIIVTTIFLSVYPPKTCAFPLRSFLGRAAWYRFLNSTQSLSLLGVNLVTSRFLIQ